MTNATIVSSIVIGKRIQTVSEGYETSLKSSADLIDGNELKHGVVKPNLKIGERKTNYKAYEGVFVSGSLIGGVTLTSDPRYKRLPAVMMGERILSTMDRGHFAVLDTGDIIDKVYTGISTHGIGYVPIVIEDKETDLRRWPRNWYGDNIKN